MIISFLLTNTDAAKEGMICGGSAKVLLEKEKITGEEFEAIFNEE